MSDPPAPDPQADFKAAAAAAAVAEIRDGMLIGLGTGSTSAFAITEIARAGLKITAVATSLRTEAAMRAAGLRVLDMADVARIDLAIDGVDELDPTLSAIKGAGGAMLREKIVAQAAERMIAIADASKWVARIGRGPVPVEVLPFARAAAERELWALGCDPVLRLRGGEPARTDQDNLVFDCRFADLADPTAIAAALSAIPGVLGHGLFLTEIDTAFIAGADGVRRHDRRTHA